MHSEDKDIIVSLEEFQSWLEYLSHFVELRVYERYFEVLIKSVPKTAPGKRCYLVYDGVLRGWMEIKRLKETVDNEICIELIPVINSTPHKISIANFDDFKYFLDNSSSQ